MTGPIIGTSYIHTGAETSKPDSLKIAFNGTKPFFVMASVVPFRVFCISVTCAVLFASKLTRADLDEGQLSPVVQTESGAVVGKIETLPHGKSVHEYLGIPYAEPPVGELRFAAPIPAKPWSGTKDATEFGATCSQMPFPIPVPEILPGQYALHIKLNTSVEVIFRINDK